MHLEPTHRTASRWTVFLPMAGPGLFLLLLAPSCRSCDQPSPPSAADAAVMVAAARDVEVVQPKEAPPITDAAVTRAATDAKAMIDEPFGEAGTSSCRLAYGPAEQPFRGPAAMLVVGQELRLIANDAGKPRVYPVAITPPPPKTTSIIPPRPASFVGMRWPPCEVAGRFVYCQASGGAITRTTLGGTDTKTVVKVSRSGTRIAAAPLGADHSVVAFLDTRQTTEGPRIEAFAALDEKDPVHLSDDGAGATTLRFIQHNNESAVAVYLDVRAAMIPMHARPVSLRGGGGGGADLALGADHVVHVGGAAERGVDFAVSSLGASTKSFLFVPMPKDTMDFGMATIAIDDPLKDDVPAVWSKYPNGIDPAPLAAAPARDGKSVWVVRTRPREMAVGSPRILELGRVDPTSAFTSYGEIALGKNVTDISLIEDGSGAVWILYGDATITWLERRVCAG